MLLFFVLFVSVYMAKRIPPTFQCKGTHYSCFKELGEHFSAEIAYTFAKYETFNEILLPWYKQNPETYNGYVELIKKSYPQYYDEIRGYADGTGHPIDWFFLLNMENEIRGSPLPEYFDKRWYVDHCTDVHVNFPDCHCIGHNEDGGLIWHNTSYFVDFTLEEKGYPDEHFVAFLYCAMLPGLAVAFNKHGLTFTMNGLVPDEGRVGIPKFIVNRDVLAASSFNEVILKSIGVPNRAFGHSMNIASIHDTRQILIELAMVESAMRDIVGNYSHMNNYRLLDIGYMADNSSTHRLARTFELPAPHSCKDIGDILGDTGDKVLPIYRKYTMISTIWNLDEKWVEIYNENPKTSHPVLKWSLVLD